MNFRIISLFGKKSTIKGSLSLWLVCSKRAHTPCFHVYFITSITPVDDHDKGNESLAQNRSTGWKQHKEGLSDIKSTQDFCKVLNNLYKLQQEFVDIQ
jgi:hypothetical protein